MRTPDGEEFKMAPPKKKIKKEIKTEPFEQVWTGPDPSGMDQDFSNMGEKEIKREIYSEFIGEAESGVTIWTGKANFFSSLFIVKN